MPTYSGYSGYADPDRARLDRHRQMAELLQQGALDTSPKSFWEGAAQLGRALIARGASDRADREEAALGHQQTDSYRKMAQLLYPSGEWNAKPASAPTSTPATSAPPDASPTTNLDAMTGDPMDAQPTAPGKYAGMVSALIGPKDQYGIPERGASVGSVGEAVEDPNANRYRAFASLARQTGLPAAMNYFDGKDADARPSLVNLGDGGVAEYNPQTGLNVLREPTRAAEKPKKYQTQVIGGRVFAYNPENPADRVDMGPAPQGAGNGGLNEYQALNYQFKLDDLDRDLEEKERQRNGSLAKVNESIDLLDRFVGDSNTFNEVYGNWLNPTGKGNDLFNPAVSPGSARANGMAMLDQLGGRAFLDSIVAMRGTGPLSDAEGARVTAAATRLSQVTQSDEAAKVAADEFRSSLVRYKRALENDIASSRRAEQERRRQIMGMMGKPYKPSELPTASPGTPSDAEMTTAYNNMARTMPAWARPPQRAMPGAAAPAQPTAAMSAPQRPPAGIDPDDWAHMTPEERAAFQ